MDWWRMEWPFFQSPNNNFSGAETSGKIPEFPQKEWYSPNCRLRNLEGSEPPKNAIRYAQLFHTPTRLPPRQAKASWSTALYFYARGLSEVRPSGCCQCKQQASLPWHGISVMLSFPSVTNIAATMLARFPFKLPCAFQWGPQQKEMPSLWA